MAAEKDAIDAEAKDLGFCNLCGALIPQQNIKEHQTFHNFISDLAIKWAEMDRLINLLAHLALIQGNKE